MPQLHMTRVAVGCADYQALQARIAAYAVGGEIRFATRFRPKRACDESGVGELPPELYRELAELSLI